MSRAMKDSGVPWLKEIPVDWKVERGKNVLALQKRPVRDNDEVVTCFRDGEVILRSLRRTEGFTMSDKEIGYQGINEGDIVIHGMDGFAGAMGVSKSTGKGSPVLIVCTPKYDAIPQYIIYYLRALAMTDVFVALATGIRERSCDLRWNKVSELEFIMPSSSEQQVIVEFLDRKCAEVDEMIGLQEQIIEELKAYKQSVITEAVTKGLNPNVPMRDSGIEWIGQIPEHWETKRLKHLSQVVRGGSPRPAGDERFYNGNIPFMKVADITKDDSIYVNSCEYTIKEAGLNHTRMINPNTLLLTNSGATLGVPKINTFVTTFNDGIAAFLNLDKGLDIIFAYYSLKARTQYFLDSASLGIGQPNLNTDIIGSVYLLIPPLYEQKDIVEYLDEKCADIDSLIQTKQSKIDSLKEYKKSIIYEYVTGKREIE